MLKPAILYQEVAPETVLPKMKSPMSKEDIDDKSSEKVLFPESHYTSDDIELISLSDIDGKEVYKINVVFCEKTG